MTSTLLQAARVAIATNVHPRTDTRIVVKQARTLSDAGFDVQVFVADGLGDHRDAGLAIHDMGRSHGRLHGAVVRGPQVLLRAIRSQAKVVHFHDPELLPFAAVFSMFTTTKFVYDVHEDVPRQALSRDYLPGWTRAIVSRALEFAERILTPRMDAVVTVTPVIQERFSRFYLRVELITNFPLLSEFHPRSADDRSTEPPYVAYVGGISATRGIHQMVRALRHVRADTELQLGGTFNDPNLRAELVAEPGWTHVVERGHLDRAGVAAVLARATAGLVTLQPTPNYVDAYPVKLFEYMSAGIPVIASDFPLWRQIVEGADCGICVDPTDPSAIAAAIDFLVENPDRASEMGRHGREAVERQYNWERESAKLLELYRELIG